MGYTHEYSNFPDKLIDLPDFKNIDDTIGMLVNQIEELRSDGNYTAAAQLIEEYSEQLKGYDISMSTINALIEHIRNTQIKSMDAGQFLSVYSEEPGDVTNGFVWLGGD